MPNLILSKPQDVFLNRLNTKFRAYVGGLGSGKTFVGCLDLIIFFARYPGTVQGYFGINYPTIRDIFYPTFEEAALLTGFTCVIKETVKEIQVFRNGFYYGTVICRSMEHPEKIVGFKIARALVDELDTLPKNKAKKAWGKIIGRARLKIDGVENGIGVTTTPEGFMFVYSQFKLNPTHSYSMVQASSYENIKNLPDDYIPSLLETYDAELVEAYVGGKFVNLKSGSVYKNFNRLLNVSTETIQEKEPLYIGCDFNVMKQAATIYVQRVVEDKTQWHAVAELKNMQDTPDMVSIIQEKWQNHGHVIYIYPDASGRARKTVDAYTSDIALLEQAGFIVRVNKKNPFVRDRILSVNKCFSNGILFVNVKECPTVTQCFEQQGYDDNGEPDKKSGFDHQNDASSYPISYEFPIRKPLIDMPIRFAI